MRDKPLLAALDIGGTKTRIELFAQDDGPPRTLVLDTPKTGDVLGDIARAVAEIADGRELISAGVGCPGPLDPLEGVVLNPPNLSQSWWGLRVVDSLSERLRCPVALENDCNLGALGEALYGGGKEYNSTLYITVSTGVGGGLVVGGKIFGGWRGFAVEIGHTKVAGKDRVCGCGRKGCVEAVASGTAIAFRAREVGWTAPEGKPLTTKTIAKAAERGDPIARNVLAEAATYLGEAIVNFIYAYDPEIVLLGGGVAQSELFMKLVRGTVEAEPMMPAFRGTIIRRAALGERSVVYGALVLAQRVAAQQTERAHEGGRVWPR